MKLSATKARSSKEAASGKRAGKVRADVKISDLDRWIAKRWKLWEPVVRVKEQCGYSANSEVFADVEVEEITHAIRIESMLDRGFTYADIKHYQLDRPMSDVEWHEETNAVADAKANRKKG